MKNSSKAGATDSVKNLSLIQQLSNLEKEWEKSKQPKNTRRCSTGSYSNNSSILTSFDQLLENSPRGLMSSLQHRRSPSDGILRVRNCGLAAEEILRERRAAISSGKLKGRRLFEAAEVVLDLDYGDGVRGCDENEICDSDWSNIIHDREVIVVNRGDLNCGKSQEIGQGDDELPDAFRKSCSFLDSCSSQEKVVVEEKMVVEVGEKRVERGGGGKLRGGGGRFVVAVAWLALVLILVILGLVVISCNGKFVHETERFLIPT